MMIYFGTAFALATLSIVACEADEKGCDDVALEGSKDIYKNQCPLFPKLGDPKPYIDCLLTKGFKFEKATTKCAKQYFSDDDEVQNTTAYFKRSCQTKNGKTDDYALQLLCCGVSEEVVPMNKTGADKADASMMCLDQLLGAGGAN